MLFFDREKDENDKSAERLADRYGLGGEYKDFRKKGQSTWEAMESLDLPVNELNDMD